MVFMLKIVIHNHICVLEFLLLEKPCVFCMQGQVEALLDPFWTCLLVMLYPQNKGLVVAQVLS